jgi:hypothetical protein
MQTEDLVAFDLFILQKLPKEVSVNTKPGNNLVVDEIIELHLSVATNLNFELEIS